VFQEFILRQKEFNLNDKEFGDETRIPPSLGFILRHSCDGNTVAETVKNRANMEIPESLELYSLVCVVRDEEQT
jgi:hypothetical protein